jgi:hypothetical protein
MLAGTLKREAQASRSPTRARATNRAIAAVALLAATSACSGRLATSPNDWNGGPRATTLHIALSGPGHRQMGATGIADRGLTDVLEFARDGSVVLTFAAPEGPRRHAGHWSSIPYCGRDLGLEPKRFAILHDCVELYFDDDTSGSRDTAASRPTRAPSAVRESPAPGTFRLLLWRGRLFEDEIARRWIDRPRFQAIFEVYFDDPSFASFASVAPAATDDDALTREGR